MFCDDLVEYDGCGGFVEYVVGQVYGGWYGGNLIQVVEDGEYWQVEEFEVECIWQVDQ